MENVTALCCVINNIYMLKVSQSFIKCDYKEKRIVCQPEHIGTIFFSSSKYGCIEIHKEIFHITLHNFNNLFLNITITTRYMS